MLEIITKYQFPLAIAITLVVLFLIFDVFFGQKHHPDEPPEVPAALPIRYLGHTIGLIRYNIGYYPRLSQKHHHPIYSVTTFGGRIYIVNSPEIAAAIFRNTKDISFAQLAAGVITRVSLSSPEATQVVCKNANGRLGPEGYGPETIKHGHAALGPGASLEDIVVKATSCISNSLDDVLAPCPGEKARVVDLFNDIRHLVVLATSDAIYGPLNPFRNPETEASYWNFELNFTMLVVNLLPSWTAPTGHQGRGHVHAAFERYFASQGHQQGSDLVKARHAVSAKHGLSLADEARLETTMAIGILSNSATSGFWMVYLLFADRGLLRRLREDMEGTALTTTVAADGSTRRVIDVARVRASPLVTAVWNETLRMAGCGTSARMIERDFRIGGKEGSYLLRAGNVVQLPSRNLNTNPAFWGPDVEAFDAGRFMEEDGQDVEKTGRVKDKRPAGAFRPFGGGVTLCPGRHISAAEIMAMAVLIALRFDMELVDDGTGTSVDATSKWPDPGVWAPSVASAVYFPKRNPKVRITARKGFEDGTWSYTPALSSNVS